MHEILLTKRIREVLDNSGYHSKYYISEDEYNEILKFYQDRGFSLDNSFKEIVKVFGNRDIIYNNNSIPAREASYETSFKIKSIWGKLKPALFKMMDIEIQHFEKEYSLKSLIPIAIMEQGPMTYYVDSHQHIYGFIDELIVCHKGKSLWLSLEKLFDGKNS